jgi:hypothetical protein
MTGVTDMIDNAVHTLAFMAGLTVLLLAVLVLIDHGTLKGVCAVVLSRDWFALVEDAKADDGFSPKWRA